MARLTFKTYSNSVNIMRIYVGWWAALGRLWLGPGTAGPAGLCPHSLSGAHPSPGRRRWVLWVLAFCFGWGGSFWSSSLLKWIFLGAPLPVPVMQSRLSEQTGSPLDETHPDVLQGCPLQRQSPFSVVPWGTKKGRAWPYIPMLAHCIVRFILF